MTTTELYNHICQKKSFLCVGLDVDLDKIPGHLLSLSDPIFSFNKAIIEATHSLCVSYKLNTAFYEAYGLKGWKSFEKTINYLKSEYPDIYTIADAKRGDIGNTSGRYARAFFKHLDFDGLTVAPYMGRDSVEPFLAYAEKQTILLALTSNIGASDFQNKHLGTEPLYSEVIKQSKKWKNAQNLMYVVGATQSDHLTEIRNLVPNSFLLIPGVGVQGGDLHKVCRYGFNEQVGLLVNSSRGIIYSGNGKDFAEKAARAAKKIQRQMSEEIDRRSISA